MKTKKMKKLALMGAAAGLLSINQGSLVADQTMSSLDLDYVIARASCKAHGRCGGDLAERDVKTTPDSKLSNTPDTTKPDAKKPATDMKTMKQMQDTKSYVDDVEETDDGTEGQ